MAGRHQGASVSVQRTLAGADVARSSEGAPCPLCRSSMEFDIRGELSQLVERCSGTHNPDCPNRRWHRAKPMAQLPPDPPKAERKTPGRKPANSPSIGRVSDV